MNFKPASRTPFWEFTDNLAPGTSFLESSSETKTAVVVGKNSRGETVIENYDGVLYALSLNSQVQVLAPKVRAEVKDLKKGDLFEDMPHCSGRRLMVSDTHYTAVTGLQSCGRNFWPAKMCNQTVTLLGNCDFGGEV